MSRLLFITIETFPVRKMSPRWLGIQKIGGLTSRKGSGMTSSQFIHNDEINNLNYQEVSVAINVNHNETPVQAEDSTVVPSVEYVAREHVVASETSREGAEIMADQNSNRVTQLIEKIESLETENHELKRKLKESELDGICLCYYGYYIEEIDFSVNENNSVTVWLSNDNNDRGLGDLIEFMKNGIEPDDDIEDSSDEDYTYFKFTSIDEAIVFMKGWMPNL